MNSSNVKTLAPRFLIVATVLLAVSWAGPSMARTSLSALEAKLDQLLAQTANIDPDDIVVLEADFDTVTTCSFDRRYVRLFSDGSVSNAEYVVPAGHTLVLTDIAWTASDGPTDFVIGRNLRMSLSMSLPNGAEKNLVYISPSLLITSSNQNTRLGTNETLRTGVPVAAGRILCPLAQNFSQSGSATNAVDHSLLRGILIRNP